MQENYLSSWMTIMPSGTYSWWNCSLMQIAGIVSAVIVLIVILGIGFLLAPLQKVFTGFT